MCWNESVSINTFVFGIFVLLLIAFNNKYSKGLQNFAYGFAIVVPFGFIGIALFHHFVH
jgi:hypothetical protein